MKKPIFKHSIAVIFCICFATISIAQTNSLQSKIVDYYNSEQRLEPTLVGLSVVDTKTDSVIVNLNAKKRLLPASLVKLYTTAAALHYLGQDYQFKTYITYTGTINDKGVLDGNIVIHGGGDPTLGSKLFPERRGFLDTIVQKVLDYGITKVTGKIIIDCSIFDSQAIPTTWVWEDLGKSYAAGVYPISINDNTFNITFSSPQQTERKGLSRVDNKIPPPVTASPYETAETDSLQFDEQRGSFVVRGAIPSPQEVLGVELVQRFIAKGLFNYRQDYMPVVIPVPGIKDTIGVLLSPPLHKIVSIINEDSNNNYAEHITKYLGYTVHKNGSFTIGAKVIMDFADSIGVTEKGLQLYDGSGLSRFSVTTPAHMTNFLIQMRKQDHIYPTFLASLPKSNMSGTLRGYGFPSYMTGKVIAKTGSMRRTRNLAGYMTTKSGNEVAFCLILNGHMSSPRESRQLIIQILQIMYDNY